MVVSPGSFTESVVEQATLAGLESAGWRVRNGAEIAPGEPAAERDDYRRGIMAQRLRDARAQLNPATPADGLEGASTSASFNARADPGHSPHSGTSCCPSSSPANCR